LKIAYEETDSKGDFGVLIKLYF